MELAGRLDSTEIKLLLTSIADSRLKSGWTELAIGYFQLSCKSFPYAKWVIIAKYFGYFSLLLLGLRNRAWTNGLILTGTDLSIIGIMVLKCIPYITYIAIVALCAV